MPFRDGLTHIGRWAFYYACVGVLAGIASIVFYYLCQLGMRVFLDFLAGFPTNPVQAVVDLRIRRQILEALDQQEVKINEERLTDVNLIKRWA